MATGLRHALRREFRSLRYTGAYSNKRSYFWEFWGIPHYIQ
ncbi:hypothetical protein BIFPSEUDO_04131 [Bifidobacterium pseudocatenulatum DSM 20438 = JCM 1200 = LMG 10505]|uniref:Uncharacterized protein n=1 Tax=Bifidobacterium pseudocatenulatum DSM 20438 = JCM 1200 = LMG 10505 TaxID=547043 RepID=C0BUP4_BIFPS|nr:hypothetical protein BIFPSEUDO_04131 [Bifidobacterium pseudocatenulatum DSM 20438 = JCM 1200 = LMG 10505]